MSSCAQVHPQSNNNLDSIFNSNFLTLDSVAIGIKKKSQLTQEQKSFLYLVDGWIDGNTSFNHYGGVTFDQKSIEKWKYWYTRNKSKIDPKEFVEAFQILLLFLTTGTAPEKDLDYLEELNKKYRRLM